MGLGASLVCVFFSFSQPPTPNPQPPTPNPQPPTPKPPTPNPQPQVSLRDINVVGRIRRVCARGAIALPLAPFRIPRPARSPLYTHLRGEDVGVVGSGGLESGRAMRLVEGENGGSTVCACVLCGHASASRLLLSGSALSPNPKPQTPNPETQTPNPK